MHWMRAGTSLLLCYYLDGRDSHREPLQQTPSQRWVLFPWDRGKPNTDAHTNKINCLQIYAVFPCTFCNIIQRSLGFRNCISLDFISNGSIDRYFIITSRLYLLLTSCQRSERFPTFPLWLCVHLSSTESRFMYAAEKLKIFSYHMYLFLLK